jgi:hypothetical protein
METYFVKFSTGNDANAGTDPAFPWKYCPGMAGWTGIATLAAGDTVYFDRGDTWTATDDHLLNVIGGVVYNGDTWGTGTRAKFSLTPLYSIDAVVFMNRDHATIPTVFKGFEIDGLSGEVTGIYMGASSYNQASVDLTGAKKRIENCVVHHTGLLAETGYHYGISITAEYHSAIPGITSNVEVINNIVHHTGRTAIALYPTNYSTQRLNVVDTVLVRGNETYESGLSGTDTAGCGIALKNDVRHATVEYNYIHNCRNGINFITGYTDGSISGSSNAIIRYNIVTQTGVIEGTDVAKPALAIEGCYNVSFSAYDNIFYTNNAHGIYFNDSDVLGTISAKIYNNTLYNNCQTEGSAEIYIGNFPATVTALEIKNNIFYTKNVINQKGIYDLGNHITAHSNNLFYNPSTDTNAQLANINGHIYYKSKADRIVIWETTAYDFDPTFKNTSNLPTGFIGIYSADMMPNTDGLSIVSGNAIDKGADLGVSYNGAINLSGRSGHLVRVSGLWDIGAYEVSASGGGSDGTTITVVITPIEYLLSFDLTLTEEQEEEGWTDLVTGIPHTVNFSQAINCRARKVRLKFKHS